MCHVLFLYLPKTSVNLWFSNVFREYRKRPVTWNGLMSVNNSFEIVYWTQSSRKFDIFCCVRLPVFMKKSIESYTIFPASCEISNINTRVSKKHKKNLIFTVNLYEICTKKFMRQLVRTAYYKYILKLDNKVIVLQKLF